MVYKTLSQKVSTGSSMPRKKTWKTQQKHTDWITTLGDTEDKPLLTLQQWEDLQSQKPDSTQEKTETDSSARGWGEIAQRPAQNILEIRERELELKRRQEEERELALKKQQEKERKKHLLFHVPVGRTEWDGSQSSFESGNFQEIQEEQYGSTDKLKTYVEDDLLLRERNILYINRFLQLLQYSPESSKDWKQQGNYYLEQFDLFKRKMEAYVHKLSAILTYQFPKLDTQNRNTLLQVFFPFETLNQFFDFMRGDETFVNKELIKLLWPESEPQHHASNDTAKSQGRHDASNDTFKRQGRHDASDDTAKSQGRDDATGGTTNSDEWTVVGTKKGVRAKTAQARFGMPRPSCTPMQSAQGYGPPSREFASEEWYGGPYGYNTGFCPQQMQPQMIYCRAPSCTPMKSAQGYGPAPHEFADKEYYGGPYGYNTGFCPPQMHPQMIYSTATFVHPAAGCAP